MLRPCPTTALSARPAASPRRRGSRARKASGSARTRPARSTGRSSGSTPPGHRTVPDRRPRRRARRAAGAAARHALARARTGRRRLAGRPARPRQGTLRALGRRLRLARHRGRAQRAAPVPRACRRARHPPAARPLAPPGGAPARPHPRLARIDRRVPRRPGPADRPARPARRVPRRLSFAARVRLQRQAGGDRLGRAADRRRVGGADDAARLRPLRRRRRRLGHDRQHVPRSAARRTGSPASTSHRRWRRRIRRRSAT